jgi:hypothetical protein
MALFFHILGRIIPIDYSYFSEGLKPPTRNGGLKMVMKKW